MTIQTCRTDRKWTIEDTDKIIGMLESGMTYNAVAKQYGVSRQRIYQVVHARDGMGRNLLMLQRCIYPGLAHRLCDMDIRVGELSDMVGCSIATMSGYLNGEKQPKLSVINKLIDITGATYEELFRGGEDDG